MKTAIISILILLLFSLSLHANETLPNEIKVALNSPSDMVETLMDKLIIIYIIRADTVSVANNKEILLSAISKSNLPDKKAITYQIEGLYAKKFLKMEKAKDYAIRALNETSQKNTRFISLLQMLAFIETDLENHMRAMESYLIVKKLLESKHDTVRQVFNYCNIADLYIKCNLYKEAIDYLNKASKLAHEHKENDIPSIIYENKAIAFFYLNKLDSLEYYRQKVTTQPKTADYDTLVIHRLNYKILLLKKDPAAIDEIKMAINNPNDNQLYTLIDLAEAHLLFNQTEKAKEIIYKLLSSDNYKKLGYIRSRLYKLMGDVYSKEKQYQLSSLYYKKGTEQSALNAQRVMKTGSILNLLKYDTIKSKYAQAQEHLEVRKNYLIFSIASAVMIILAMFFLYRSLSIKKKYDELKFNKLNTEISFMNSHEVRRYLSNILGIIMVIKLSDNKHEAYSECEDALLDSAENLDVSIKSIAAKLNVKAGSSYQSSNLVFTPSSSKTIEQVKKITRN